MESRNRSPLDQSSSGPIAVASSLRPVGYPRPPELRVLNIASGNSETVFRGISIADYDISGDEKEVAYSTTALNGPSKVCLGMTKAGSILRSDALAMHLP
jgi:hypothetical protein